MTASPTTAAMRARRAAAYASAAVTTATPERIVVMLYDRLVLDLQRGEAALRAGDRAAAHEQLVHAQDVVSELLSGLDPAAWSGGPALASLYTYALTELANANVSGDADRAAGVRALVEPLREAWALAAAELATRRDVLGAAG